ncbi:MAG: Lrp/AsnC family transcriptional regulator [Candidatus Aureabacteria bacterium]|nr:Lrp/AsnC family transcriptional regulator [Candidatus Auribacterota bacterium]
MNIDSHILSALGDPLPIVSAPFRNAARRAGMKEQSLIALLRRKKKTGIIRRIGAVLDHREIGLKANALVAWNVPKARLREAARHLSRYSQVSHCYARRVSPIWPYRLYTMVHARSRTECLALVRKMSRFSHVTDYKLLFTVKELKKQKMDFSAQDGLL